jgi:muramoyltetrapeptide carboxypeptidase LdcA involved in peptidoglycan recycling
MSEPVPPAPLPLIKPPCLRPGDRIAAVSLSWGGPGAIPIRYQAGVRQIEETFGLQVVAMPNALRDPAWVHANPQARADDLLQAFDDPAIRGVFSTIAGDDSIRILPYLDLDVLRRNPKVFIGFSDTTITHLACFRAGLVSFYGPAIMTGFAENGGILPYLEQSIRKTLFSAEPPGVIPPNMDGWTVERLEWAVAENQSRKRKLNPSDGWRFLQGQGVSRGHLIGGCIEVLDWLRGTDYWPPPDAWQGAILFLETSEDAPSPQAVLWMLRCYAALGVLPRLAGLLFGRPGGLVPPEQFVEYDRAILQVVAEEQGLTGLPVVTGMDFGHTDPIFTLPYGVQAEIDCQAKTFAIVESGVSR